LSNKSNDHVYLERFPVQGVFKLKLQHFLIGQQFQLYDVVKSRMPGYAVFGLFFRSLGAADIDLFFLRYRKYRRFSSFGKVSG
jgi:hypothetical protein